MDVAALLLFMAAFVAGLVGAMVGMGGGFFLVPFLALYFGLPMHYAIGTSAIAVIAASSAAASNYVRAGLTNIRLGLLLQTCTAGGAIVGGILATMLPDSILAAVFGVVMLYASYSIFSSSRRNSAKQSSIESSTPAVDNNQWQELEATYYDHALTEKVTYRPTRVGSGMGACSAAGVVAGMLGIGGGPFQVPLMHLLMKMPLRAAAGTSVLNVSVVAVASAFIYYGNGFVAPSFAVPAVMGVFIGALLGTRVAQRVSSRALSIILAVALLYISLQMIFRAFGIQLR